MTLSLATAKEVRRYLHGMGLSPNTIMRTRTGFDVTYGLGSAGDQKLNETFVDIYGKIQFCSRMIIPSRKIVVITIKLTQNGHL
jgi:hypothetical protein